MGNITNNKTIKRNTMIKNALDITFALIALLPVIALFVL
tara:strand:- start:249 stop:365 length:117 start_codon:yes stop_codon:yes gene_type:complete